MKQSYGGETIGSAGDAITLWRSNMNEVCFSIASGDGTISECHLTPRQAKEVIGAMSVMLLDIQTNPTTDDAAGE